LYVPNPDMLQPKPSMFDAAVLPSTSIQAGRLFSLITNIFCGGRKGGL